MGKRIANEYILMHKDVPVCLMEISDEGVLGSYKKNKEAEDHFPLGGQMNGLSNR